MGPPATFGDIHRVYDAGYEGAYDLGKAHFDGGKDHYAVRGWELHVAYHTNGNQNPTPSVDGYIHRYKGANAKVTDLGLEPPGADGLVATASWTRKAYGDELSALDDKSKLTAAYSSTATISSFYVGVGGFGVNIDASQAGSATSDTISWVEDTAIISGRGDDIIQVGYAVGWAIYAAKSGTNAAGQTRVKVAFLDALHLARGNMPEPGETVTTSSGTTVPTPVKSLNSATKAAFVRVGYSAPGGGGVVYTSAKWLKN